MSGPGDPATSDANGVLAAVYDHALQALRISGTGASGAPADASYLTAVAESGLSNEKVFGSVVFYPPDVVANRLPASATIVGALYFATDVASGTLYRSDGVSTWTTVGTLGTTSPLTTKGDILGHSTVDARVPIGADGFVLTADAAQTLGLKWAAAVSALASLTDANISSAANGQVLQFQTSDSKWHNVTVSGDVTIAAGGAVTIKTNVALAGSPTTTTQAVGDNTTKIATDAFVTTAVNNAIAGVNPAVAVQAATTQASDTSGLTYNNGVAGIGATFTGSVNTAFTVDGYTFTALNQRLLVKNDTQSPSGAFNGVYYVTQVQTAILPPILTRALDYDAPSDINNTGAIPVVNGTVNTNTSWLLTSTVNTVGTDPLTYVQFSRNPNVALSVSGGGTGLATLTAHAVQIGNGTTAVTQSAVGATGTVLAGNTGADPTFQSITSNDGTVTVSGLDLSANSPISTILARLYLK